MSSSIQDGNTQPLPIEGMLGQENTGASEDAGPQDDESLEEYMLRLLDRVQDELKPPKGSEPTPVHSPPKLDIPTSLSRHTELSKEEHTREMNALREMANQTSRSAIATYTFKQRVSSAHKQFFLTACAAFGVYFLLSTEKLNLGWKIVALAGTWWIIYRFGLKFMKSTYSLSRDLKKLKREALTT